MRPTEPAGTYPRPLSKREADILQLMLSVDDDRMRSLRDQATSAMVTAMCGCGCATVYLAVDRKRWPAAALCSPCVSTTVRIIVDNTVYGLLVFLDDGWLSKLEIWWIDQPPPDFPPPEDFLPPTLDC